MVVVEEEAEGVAEGVSSAIREDGIRVSPNADASSSCLCNQYVLV